MRIYNIIISNIPTENSDLLFAKFVNDNKLDYWRYTALNWILLTPDNISTNMLIGEVTKAYGSGFSCVLEISINDFGGVAPASKEMISDGWAPFKWFHEIKDPKFIPRWEREKDSKK